jgi:hypothetical protein
MAHEQTRLLADTAMAFIQRAQSLSAHDWRLTVAINNPGGLTAHQTVEVERMDQGFDWTAGQIILQPAMPLSRLSPEEVAAVMQSVRQGQSWHAYEREKKLRARIKELEARIEATAAPSNRDSTDWEDLSTGGWSAEKGKPE